MRRTLLILTLSVGLIAAGDLDSVASAAPTGEVRAGVDAKKRPPKRARLRSGARKRRKVKRSNRYVERAPPRPGLRDGQQRRAPARPGLRDGQQRGQQVRPYAPPQTTRRGNHQRVQPNRRSNKGQSIRPGRRKTTVPAARPYIPRSPPRPGLRDAKRPVPGAAPPSPNRRAGPAD